MVRIRSLFFNPDQPLNQVNKSELEYDRFIFDIAKKTGFGTALLSAGGILYSHRVSSKLWTASWTVALVVSLLFIRRVATIIGNIDKAGPGELESDHVKPPEVVVHPQEKKTVTGNIDKADPGESESKPVKPPESLAPSQEKTTVTGQIKHPVLQRSNRIIDKANQGELTSDRAPKPPEEGVAQESRHKRQRSKSVEGSQPPESMAGSKRTAKITGKADREELISDRPSKPSEMGDSPEVKKTVVIQKKIGRAATIGGNIDRADRGELPSDRPSKSQEIVDSPEVKKTLVGRVSGSIRARAMSLNGSQSSQSIAGSKTPVDISERFIGIKEASKSIERTVTRNYTNSRSSQDSEEVSNQQTQIEKMDDFVKVYDSKGSSDDAIYALRDLINTDWVYGLRKLTERREKGETTPSAEFLVSCLEGFKESEEGSSVYGFKKDGILGVLSLLSASKMPPTTPEVFHALCLLLSDSCYRESFQIDKLIPWLLQDVNYRLHHFKKLVSIDCKLEESKQEESSEAASPTFIPVFEHFQARPHLVDELLADETALEERQYLWGWVVATARTVEEVDKPFIKDAHEEWLNLPQGKKPVHFLNRSLAEQGFDASITKGVDHFRVHAAFCLLSGYLKNCRLSIGHQRILKMMLFILEGAEHLGEKAVKTLFMQLLGEAENQRWIVPVFIYLLQSFWCYRDKNKALDAKKEIYDPIRDQFIAFFKSSGSLQRWKQGLTKQDDLNIYLNKLLGVKNNSNGALRSSSAQ